MRALRNRVGEGGFLIGHSGYHALVGATHLDVCLAGEFSVLHDILLASPESCAYFALLSACGGHLLGADTADRKMFAGPRATAFCAALGLTSHPFLSPGKPFSETAGYMFPLWNVMRCLPGDPVRLYSPGTAPTAALRCEQPGLFPVAFQTAGGQTVVLLTNLGATTDGTVEVRLSELGLSSSAPIRPVAVEGVPTCRVEGNCLRARDLAPERFCAALIG